MARPRPPKKREPATSAERRVLPMELELRDRIVDETGEYEVIGRPYRTAILEWPTTIIWRTGSKIYYMGDTGLFGDMKPIADYYNPDLVLMLIGGHFVMDLQDAA